MNSQPGTLVLTRPRQQAGEWLQRMADLPAKLSKALKTPVKQVRVMY